MLKACPGLHFDEEPIGSNDRGTVMDLTTSWLSALRPFMDGELFRVPLKVPIHLPGARMVQDVNAVFMRFPQWTGSPFIDDFGKKSAALVDLDGEHLFAELAVLRLLEKEGWKGRWVNTYSARGEVWKYLTEWRDLPRNEQKTRPIEEGEPRQLLARIAAVNKPARYAGCWDTFAWRGDDYAFLECKRTPPTYKDLVKKEQEDWLRSALYLGDRRLSRDSFCFVQWDYQ